MILRRPGGSYDAPAVQFRWYWRASWRVKLVLLAVAVILVDAALRKAGW
jgi:hypothetical protein